MSPFQASKVTSLLKSKEMFQDDTSWKQNVSQTNDVPDKEKENLDYVDLQLDFGPTGPAFAIKPAAERRCLEKIEIGRKIRLVEVWPGQGSGAGPAIDTAPDQKSQAPTFKNLINWKSSEIQRWPGAGHEPCPPIAVAPVLV